MSTTEMSHTPQQASESKPTADGVLAPANGSTPAIFIAFAVTVWTALDSERFAEREKAAMICGCIFMLGGYWINRFVWWALDKWLFGKASNTELSGGK